MLGIDIRAIAAQARPYVPTRTVMQETLDGDEVYDILDSVGYKPQWGKGGAVIRFTPPVEWRLDLKHKDNWWIDLETGRMYTNTGSVASLTDEAAKLHGARARMFLEELSGEVLSTRYVTAKQVQVSVPSSPDQALGKPQGDSKLEWHPFTAASATSSNWVERLLFELTQERVADPVKWGLGWCDFGLDPLICAGRYYAAAANKQAFDTTGEHLKNSEFRQLVYEFTSEVSKQQKTGSITERDLLKLAMAGGRTNAFHVVQPAIDPQDGKILSCFFWNPFYKAETEFFEQALLVEAQVPDWEPGMHEFMVRKRIAKRHNKYMVLSDAKSRLPKAKCVFSWPEHIKYEGELVWLVEGVYDALALIEAGIPAVSTWTCQLQREQIAYALHRLKPKGFVLAFDDDEAGSKGASKLQDDLRKMAALWDFEVYTGHTGVKALGSKDAADTLVSLKREFEDDEAARQFMKKHVLSTVEEI